MDKDVLFFTACNAGFFELCIDLLASLQHAFGEMPRVRVLDVGLKPEQAVELAERVETVIVPDWDMPRRTEAPWLRAMYSRPFLPKYSADAKIIVWIDADAWVQRPEPLSNLISAAGDGRLTIVEEEFGEDFTATIDIDGKYATKRFNPASVKANTRRCYEQCFDPEIVASYGEIAQFNCGVFALRADSSTWTIWREILARALDHGYSLTSRASVPPCREEWDPGSDFARAIRMLDENSLNVGIRQGLIPVAAQPLTANFVCGLGLPWFDPDMRLFTLPRKRRDHIGVVHLTDAKGFAALPVRQFPIGEAALMSLRFEPYRSAC